MAIQLSGMCYPWGSALARATIHVWGTNVFLPWNLQRLSCPYHHSVDLRGDFWLLTYAHLSFLRR